jgi:hypothetical protein
MESRGSIIVSQGKIDKNIINPEASNINTAGDGADRLLFLDIEIQFSRNIYGLYLKNEP